MTQELTPTLIAQLDQELTGQNDRIDALLATLRGQAEQYGQVQATANMALALAYLPRDVKDLTLLAVLTRLAFRKEETDVDPADTP